MRKLLFVFLALLPSCLLAAEKVVAAYVTSWTETIPDPTVMTHINYAFGHVNETFNGVGVDNPDRLRQIVALKRKAPALKVLLSVGGWGSGRFSEMASSDETRLSFAKDCRSVVEEYGLDGIDIDWEYPTQSSAKISSSPEDTRNFTSLMRDLRQQLGDKLLTCATIASGEFIDFDSCIGYVDWVNVMSYDMGNPPYHHSALYPSEITNWMTTSASVEAHLKAGVPKDKIVMGMPLYGRGLRGHYDDDMTVPAQYEERWHEQSMVPYLVNQQGELVNGFENEQSIGIKCQYIIDHGLRGGMYWEYGNERQEKLRNVICNILMHGEASPYTADYAGKRVRFRALLIWDPSAEPAHVEFDKQAIRFFHKLSYGEGFTYDVRTESPASLDTLRQYQVVVMLNALPHGEAARKSFEQYMEQGGGWLGFHATGYNDANTHWPWLNKFLGCGPFLANNWPPQPALVDVEVPHHAVTRTLPPQFVAPASEFYQFSPSPRANSDVEVLVSISPKNYPFGIKDIITHGDFPIVWTNKNYRMVYLNMGHGDEAFIDATQNLLFTNAFRWVALFSGADSTKD